jgi:hypothetical protein
MKLQATNEKENAALRTFAAEYIDKDLYADVKLTFANGYRADILRHEDHIFIDLYRRRENGLFEDVCETDDIDTDGAFVYNELELRVFLKAVANAKTEFEVGFAYGRLKQAR